MWPGRLWSTAFRMVSYTGSGQMMFLYDAFARNRGMSCWTTYMAETAGHHSLSRTLVGKSFCNGFYWPTTLNDAAELMKSYEAYQFHAK